MSESLKEINVKLLEEIRILKEKLSNNNLNRKDVVLQLIKDGFDTSDAIAEELGITKKNVASILTGLRNDGNHIHTIKVNKQNILTIFTDDQMKMFAR
jgi:biotin operon repressor